MTQLGGAKEQLLSNEAARLRVLAAGTPHRLQGKEARGGLAIDSR
jgi:hypothetical protein